MSTAGDIHRYQDQRIALLSATLGGGGAERVMVTLANAFLHYGCQVDMVLVKKTGPYVDQLDPDVRVVDLSAGQTRYALWPLVRYLRSVRPNAMLSTQRHVNTMAAVARLVAQVPTRLVVREANTISAITKDGNSSPVPKGGLLAFLHRKSYAMADALVAPSEGVARDLINTMGFKKHDITVIPNPLPLQQLLQQSDEPVDHPWFLPGSTPVILGVGRLAVQKDFQTLIRAFAKVVQHRQARLVILGEGNERTALEDLVDQLGLREHVMMPGFVDNPYTYMRCAAVFVLSSRWEGLPNVLLQAIAVGVPVVSTDCPSGPREVLDRGRWGKLVPVGDVDAMASAIMNGLDGQIELMPESIVSARYDVDVVTNSYLTLLLAPAIL